MIHNHTDGTTLAGNWEEYWNLAGENGRWLLNDPELSKASSKVEGQ
ncbi:hypothetical protein [Niallia sp. NCCP-28]|nr:hypothetical protein [Niallia sp. NCCP-28]GKU83024.1 hypothetical protein NCCP28_24200 [Niallia sp. NCCP-28]